MEFQHVVDRRRMVRNYADRAGRPGAIVDRALRNATRAPSAGFSQGWAFLRARHARRRTPLLGAPPPTRAARRRPTRWLTGHDARAGRDRALLQQGRLPRPLRRARQGLDRPRRGALAGALLAHGHRDGEPADPADRRRRGPRRAASSASRRTRIAAVDASSASPTTYDPIGAITIGHLADDAAGSPPGVARAHVGTARIAASTSSVHRGGWHGAASVPSHDGHLGA